MIVFLVAVLLSGHVTELIDQWDHTMTTGRDVDYSLVVVAACAGIVLIVATRLASFFADFGVHTFSPITPVLTFSLATCLEKNSTGLSPPPNLSLRI
jgi:hypothetical protein